MYKLNQPPEPGRIIIIIVMELEVGDVVRLKSGSPEMTVCEYPFVLIDGTRDIGRANCEWFVEGALRHSTFKVEELSKVDQDAISE